MQKFFKLYASKSYKFTNSKNKVNLPLFSKMLDYYFSLEEFQGICFDIDGIDYENLVFRPTKIAG